MSPCFVHPQKRCRLLISVERAILNLVYNWCRAGIDSGSLVPQGLTLTPTPTHMHTFSKGKTKKKQTVCIRSEGRSGAPKKTTIPTRQVVCVPSNLTLHRASSLLSRANLSWKRKILITVGYVSTCERWGGTRVEPDQSGKLLQQLLSIRCSSTKLFCSLSLQSLSLCTSPPPLSCSLISLCQHIPQPPNPTVSFFF